MPRDKFDDWFHETEYGKIFHGDSMEVLRSAHANSVNLIVTSPPFGLVAKKEYGNVSADHYVDWFRPFAEQFHRVLSENGSLVIDIGGTWNQGSPTKHLYQFKLLIMLCEEYGFHLAQDFYWWNPAKLPTPAEWVTIRRIRVKDATNKVWWLSKSPWPKANNQRVLQKYSKSMEHLLEHGYRANKRPSGHDISKAFSRKNAGSIPPNLLAVANTESNSAYLRYCKENKLKVHPARFPSDLPEFFVRFLTDENDVVLDPFAGSCVTGEVCEKLQRHWICAELRHDYLEGAKGRFLRTNGPAKKPEAGVYQIGRPSAGWGEPDDEPLDPQGGRFSGSARRKRQNSE